jgi:hypothetical protein
MAKIVGKASALRQEISSVYTTIAQLTSIKKAGSKSLTYDSTTLDGGVAKTYDATGYAEPGTVAFEGFYDPALSGHQSYTDLIETPVATNFRVVHSNTTTQTFSCTGFGLDYDIVMDDGVKMSGELQISGTAGWPT